MTESPLVDIQDLVVQYASRSVPAVDGVSLEVPRGGVHGLVGESGSGKSTLARAVLGLTGRGGRILRGSVAVNGVDVLSLSARRVRELRGAVVGYVGQNPFGSLHPVLRIGEQFEQIRRAHPRRLDKNLGTARARQLLGELGFHEPDRVLRSYAHELSGGMAQRVVIGLAFYLQPDLVVADEPTTGLDVTVQRQILDLVVGAAQARGAGLLIVTHDLGVVANYCETVSVLYSGRLLEDGPVKSVMGTPGQPYTEALVASVPRRGKALALVAGTVDDRPTGPGCPFQPCCPLALERCALPLPVGEMAAGWTVACHRLDERRAACQS